MPPEAPTKGFKLNHVGLQVADIDRSVAFYSSAFGLKELGRMSLDTVTVVFLGYPDPSAPLFAREGVLELVCGKDAEKAIANSNTDSQSRLVKLAFSVPDMKQAVEHFKSHNVKFAKEAGVSQGLQVVANFLGCETPDKGLDKPLWDAAVAVAFIEDPDGYLIEIIPY